MYMAKNKNRINFANEDSKLKLMVKRRGIGDESIKNYNTVFNEIFEEFNITPSQIVEIGKKEQKPFKTDDGLYDICVNG